ncbi:hypothetical protein EC915_101398 [Pseudomonas sp. LP_7_YM]|nr:hypothetical protein EC915_101398 [Pseudomonas sp. LP_7_YM]
MGCDLVLRVDTKSSVSAAIVAPSDASNVFQLIMGEIKGYDGIECGGSAAL